MDKRFEGRIVMTKNKKTVKERIKEYQEEAQGGAKHTVKQRPGNHLPQTDSPETIEDFVGQRIEQAMREGVFDNLPGRGKPLNLRKHEHVPEDMQMAYNLLEDNDLTPGWISKRKSILDGIEQFREEISEFVAWYQAEFEVEMDATARQKLMEESARVKAQWADKITVMNQRIQELNIEQPLAHLEVLKLRLEDELTRVGL